MNLADYSHSSFIKISSAVRTIFTQLLDVGNFIVNLLPQMIQHFLLVCNRDLAYLEAMLLSLRRHAARTQAELRDL